ncbi:MAG: GTP cyclohydrolase I, partial [Spongiibacter sp.]
RGVEKQNSVMRTSAMLGVFKENQATRAEFMALINKR